MIEFYLIWLVLLPIIIGFFCFFWFKVLVAVMSSPDNAFSGKYDKALWVTLFIFTPFFAPFLYIAWMRRLDKKI